MKILTQHATRTTFYVFILSLFLVACQGEPETVQVTVPVTVEVTRQVTVPANNPVVTEVEPTAAATSASSEPSTTPPAAPLTPGSEAYPIQLLFPPTIPLPVLEARSEPFFRALRDATGFHYLLRRTETNREMLDLLCNEPDRTVAFMAPELYILAHEQCGAQAGQVFQRLGVTWNAGMVVVRNESPIQSLEDLNEQT